MKNENIRSEGTIFTSHTVDNSPLLDSEYAFAFNQTNYVLPPYKNFSATCAIK